VFYLYPDLYHQMKKTYRQINTLKSKSGFTWTNDHGMGVTDQTEEQWRVLVAVCGHMSLC
jgi:hypothetical protein